MTKMHQTRPTKVCAVCLRPLSYFITAEDRAKDEGRYVHIDQEYGTRDHAVIAVDPEEINLADLNAKCDFCYVDGANDWTVVTKPFAVMVTPEIVQNLSSLWAACTPCKDFIQAGDWRGLLDRSIEQQIENQDLPDRVKTGVTTQLSRLFVAVRTNFVLVREANLASDVQDRDMLPLPIPEGP